MPPAEVVEVAEPPSHLDLGARRLAPDRVPDDGDGRLRSRTAGVREE